MNNIILTFYELIDIFNIESYEIFNKKRFELFMNKKIIYECYNNDVLDYGLFLYYIGYYFENMENINSFNNYLMKKYYLRAIENNNINAMTAMGFFYFKQKNYELMKLYYLIV